jgi:hypothetical protein
MEMGTKQQIIGICALALGMAVSSCGNLRKKTLMVVDNAKPNVESAFQGMTAKEPENGARRDRLILDVHYNDWLGERENVNTGWRSIGYNWNFYRDIPLNRASTVSIATGLRFGKTVIQHNGLIAVGQNIENSILNPALTQGDFRSNQRFIQSHLELPLELRFRGVNKKSIRFTLGGSIGWRLNSYERWREGSEKFREYNHANAMMWRAGTYMRLGYNQWSFYGAYYLTPWFEGSGNSKLNTIQMGVSFSFF